NAADYLYGDFGTGLFDAGSVDALYGQGGNDLLFGKPGDTIQGSAGFSVAETSGGASNIISFGTSPAGAQPAAPAAEPVPSVSPPADTTVHPQAIDDTNVRALPSLPDGLDVDGHWTDQGGSAQIPGLSGGSGIATQPSAAAGALGTYVAWIDTRSGIPA